MLMLMGGIPKKGSTMVVACESAVQSPAVAFKSVGTCKLITR